jgi:hypothetical protein
VRPWQPGGPIEPALGHVAEQLGLGLGLIECRPVRAGFEHRHVAVGRGEDSSGLLEFGRPHAAVIAGAVEALVVGTGDPADRCERGGLREGTFGEVRVQPNALPFAEPECGGLLPDRVWHAYAAEVVGERCAPEERHFVLVQVRPPRGSLGELRDGRAVLTQPRRLQAGDRGDRREAFFDRLTVQPDRGRRLDRERVLPHARLVELREYRVQVRDRQLDQARLVSGAGALLEHCTRTLGPGCGEEQRGVLCDMQQADRERDLLAGHGRDPQPVPAREHVSERRLDARAQAEPDGEPLCDLAHRFKRFASPRTGLRDRLLKHLGAHLGRPSEPDEGAIELEYLVRLGGVDQVERGPVRDVVAEQLARLVPVGGAAGGV